MKAEIKYIAILYFANMLSLPFLTMTFAWDFRPSVILPMAILGVCTSTISLWVGMRWMSSENIIFLTKDTVIDGEKMGGGK
jgi:hypothetical protein